MILTPKNSAQAFTLVEIMTILIILSAIAGLAIPQYFSVVENMKAKEGEQILLVLLGAQKRYSLENNGSYSDTISALDVDAKFLTENFETNASSELTDANVDNNANAIANITRIGSYTLSINDKGVFSCTGGDPGLCGELGY